MSEKRTKADKAQRQADQLQKSQTGVRLKITRKKKTERVTKSAKPEKQVS